MTQSLTILGELALIWNIILHFNVTNHWNALTDGHIKYIFQAYSSSEQLFDLDSDPGELKNLAEEKEWKETTEKWRSYMVDQFNQEKRGNRWVDENTRQLKRRIRGQLHSPFYPGARRPR